MFLIFPMLNWFLCNQIIGTLAGYPSLTVIFSWLKIGEPLNWKNTLY